MTKNSFISLMVIEGFFALVSMGLLCSDLGAVIYPISLAGFAAVLAPFFVWLKKTEDEAKKRKIRLYMVLLLLLPIVVAVATVLCVVTALMLYFG